MNARLCVDRSNQGAGATPLVCLHGWGMNLRVFDDLRSALPEQETWAIDLPGHGPAETARVHDDLPGRRPSLGPAGTSRRGERAVRA